VLFVSVLATRSSMSNAAKQAATQKELDTQNMLDSLLTVMRDRELLELTSCDSILATFSPGESITYAFTQFFGSDPVFNFLFVLFGEKINFGVQVVKICASCEEILSLPTTDLSVLDTTCLNQEVFERYCGEDAYGSNISHSGLVIYPLETIGDLTSIKAGTLTGFVYNRPSKVSIFGAPSETF
jgi:hypothetical protein